MLIPEDFAQCNLVFDGLSVPRGAQLTFGVDNSEGGLSATGIGGIVNTAWATTLKLVSLDTLRLTGTLVKLGPNDTGAQAFVSTNQTGSQDATAESPQVSLVVNKVTALGGRANRGRWFLPAVRESYVDGSGNVDTSGAAAIQAKLDAFLTALATANTPMVILHNDRSPDLTPDPTPVTSLVLTSKAGSQRRRLRRVGGRRRSSSSS